MNDLDKFVVNADKNSPFLRFEEGEPVVGVYKGAKLVDNSFKPGEQTMEYTLNVDGVAKTFKSGSTKLARIISKYAVGTTLQLVKTGESFKTIWYVSEVEDSSDGDG